MKGKLKIQSVIHLLIWISGTVFLLSGAFHTNIWFDESYTVGLVNHNLWDIITISAADVHPPFYYILLKLYSILFGTDIIALRIFSVIFSSLLALLGFTHIRKDFGQRIGLLFTLLTFLFTATFRFANEIRMYTLAPFLVTLMAIYAYRWYKSGFEDRKSKVLFLVFSILSAYTHHYGLITAAAVNILFLLHSRKNNSMKTWYQMAAIQVISYFWGIYCLLRQFISVAGGFWINMSYPQFIHETASFFLQGTVKNDIDILSDILSTIYNIVSFIFWAVIIISFIAHRRKNKDSSNHIILIVKVLGISVGVIFAVSLIRPLYFVRYITIFSGLVFFFVAYAIDSMRSYFLKAGILVVLSTVLILRVIPIYEVTYSRDNNALDQFIQENVMEGDIVISESVGILPVAAVKHPDVKFYFYNSGHWGVETAYKAFGPQMETIRELSEVLKNDGRVWLLSERDSEVINYIIDNSHRNTVTEYDEFALPYHNLVCNFILIE